MNSVIALEIDASNNDDTSEAYVQLFLSRSGAEVLHAELGRLLSGRSDHFHLFHPDWGADDLTVILTRPGSIPAKQIDVRMYNEQQLAELVRSTKSFQTSGQ